MDNTEIFDKRPYDNCPYLILPRKIFKIKLGNQLPAISAYVYQKDNLFGDPMPLNLAGTDIKFNIYSSNRKLISSGTAIIVDMNISKIEYQLKTLDLIEPGDYYGEFIFKDVGDDVYSLPILEEKQKIHIIIIP
jgi:hypothetical protein